MFHLLLELDDFCQNLITNWRFIIFQLCKSNFILTSRLGPGTNGSALYTVKLVQSGIIFEGGSKRRLEETAHELNGF
jgi:hypothetical protein